MKKTITTIGMAMLMSITATLFIGCAGKDSAATETAVATETPKVEPIAAPEPKAPADIVITKKDTGKTADLNFLVKNISEPAVPMFYFGGADKGTKKFIAVQFWVKNVSDKPMSIGTNELKLIDQDDAEYVVGSYKQELVNAPLLYPAEDPNTVELKPNEKKSGTVIYVTNITSKATKIVYNNVTVKL